MLLERRRLIAASSDAVAVTVDVGRKPVSLPLARFAATTLALQEGR